MKLIFAKNNSEQKIINVVYKKDSKKIIVPIRDKTIQDEDDMNNIGHNIQQHIRIEKIPKLSAFIVEVTTNKDVVPVLMINYTKEVFVMDTSCITFILKDRITSTFYFIIFIIVIVFLYLGLLSAFKNSKI